MNKTKLEVVRVDGDVIATSTFCNPMSGMTPQSYMLKLDAYNGKICNGILLTGADKWIEGYATGCNFDYYDENGQLKTKDANDLVPNTVIGYNASYDSGVWFHYDTQDNGKWQICKNPSHHSNN